MFALERNLKSLRFITNNILKVIMSAEGEVERKVRELREEIFGRYNPHGTQVDQDGNPWISKE